MSTVCCPSAISTTVSRDRSVSVASSRTTSYAPCSSCVVSNATDPSGSGPAGRSASGVVEPDAVRITWSPGPPAWNRARSGSPSRALSPSATTETGIGAGVTVNDEATARWSEGQGRIGTSAFARDSPMTRLAFVTTGPASQTKSMRSNTSHG